MHLPGAYTGILKGRGPAAISSKRGGGGGGSAPACSQNLCRCPKSKGRSCSACLEASRNVETSRTIIVQACSTAGLLSGGSRGGGGGRGVRTSPQLWNLIINSYYNYCRLALT